MIDNSSSNQLDAGTSSSASGVSAQSVTETATAFATDAVAKAKDIGSRLGSQVIDRMGNLPDMSRDYAGRLDAHARANPWLHVGLVGIGSLALGYFLGRRFSSRIEETEVQGLGEIYNN